MTSPLFNPSNIVGSIARFTERGPYLIKKQRKQVFELIENWFSNRAFENQVLRDHSLDDINFKRYDLPYLMHVAGEIGIKAQDARHLQFLANISLIFQQNFSQDLYQVRVVEKGGDALDGCSFWGWIRASDVTTSKLMKRLESGTLVLKEGEITPSTLFALQRFYEYLTSETNETTPLDLSFNNICELASFVLEWEIKPLAIELAPLFQRIDASKMDLSEKQTYASVKKALEGTLSTTNRRSPSQSTLVYPSPLTPTGTLVFPPEDAETESDYTQERFDENLPYDSIDKFAARFCTFPKAAQLQFFATIARFFATQAYIGAYIPIPKSIENRFARIVLPFLKNAMPQGSKVANKLLATIQMVSRVIFQEQSPSHFQIIEIDAFSELFIERFCGEYAGQKEAPKIKALNELMRALFSGQWRSYEKMSALAKKTPLNEAEIVAVYNLLQKEEFRNWDGFLHLNDSIDNPIIALQSAFEIGYQGQLVDLLLRLKKTLADMNLTESVSKFVIALTDHVEEDNTEVAVEQLIARFSLNKQDELTLFVEDSKAIVKCLEDSEIRAIFKASPFEKRYALAMSLLKRYPQAVYQRRKK